jgi:hypothetical protein
VVTDAISSRYDYPEPSSKKQPGPNQVGLTVLSGSNSCHKTLVGPGLPPAARREAH